MTQAPTQTCSEVHDTPQGLGLGREACDILRSFGLGQQLEAVSLPLTTDINRAVRPGGSVRVLSRDDQYDHQRRACPHCFIPLIFSEKAERLY